MLFDSSGQVPAGLANVTTGTLFTFEFINHIGGETDRHTVFVRENFRRFERFKDNAKAVGVRENFVNTVDSFQSWNFS